MTKEITKSFIAIPALLMPLAVNAYVGPGAGVTAIGSILALFAFVFLTLIGFVWYPLKRLFSKNKNQEATEESVQESGLENGEKPTESNHT